MDQMTGGRAGRRASMVDGSGINPVRRPVACQYGASVPELSAGIPPIPGLSWESLSHRQVLAELATVGWVPCGVGDWAVALRSPEGSLVARVCPFDPAYWAFVDLCRECAGNRWLPGIELAADLDGGGSVVFLEYVAPVGHPVVKQFAEQWRARASDPEFQELRRAAQRSEPASARQPTEMNSVTLSPGSVKAGRPDRIGYQGAKRGLGGEERNRDHGAAGRAVAVGERGPAAGCDLARAYGAHRRVEAAGGGAAEGAAAEHRR
jgi:hypothetical protein